MKECALNSRRILTLSNRWSSGWSEWTDIWETPNYAGCGVYKIRLVNSEGFPVEIPRFIDTDKNGILQICYSENIKRGIYRFLRSAEGKRYTHAEGERLRLLMRYTGFKERYKDCGMQYSFKKQLSRREARVEQEKLLKCYVKKYGEVPPNNNNFPDKYIDWKVSAILIRPNLSLFQVLSTICLPIYILKDSEELEGLYRASFV